MTFIMDIRFPNLGWLFENVPDGFTIFGIELKLYGLIISLGFLLGYLSAYYEAKRTKQDPDLYTDYVTYMVIPAIIGARMYSLPLINTKIIFGKSLILEQVGSLFMVELLPVLLLWLYLLKNGSRTYFLCQILALWGC